MSDLHHFLFGPDQGWPFLLECALRTLLMFIILLVLFKLTGKKEVRQFSTLELIVIIGLGSAVGDPMIYKDVGILPSLVAIFMVLALYWGTNVWSNRFSTMGKWVEGEVAQVFAAGRLNLELLGEEGLSSAEFFGDLRAQHVEHLGQVRCAYLEIDGRLSVFFHTDADVRPGLHILPEPLKQLRPLDAMPEGTVACGRCGSTALKNTMKKSCAYCGHDRFGAAVDMLRVG